jgi:predicted Zn-dependent protease
MVSPENAGNDLEPVPEPTGPDTASGYNRLSLMRFRAWQILLVLLVLAGVSFLLFPRERRLVDFHLERGRTGEALVELDRMLRKRPTDPELLELAAETRFRAGDMEEALRLQEQAARLSPENTAALRRLARFQEWSRNPKEALRIYERIASLEPSDREAREKTLEYARYLGRTDLEARAVVRLLESGETADPAGDPLLRLLTRTLEDLASERTAGPPDPLLDELLVRLYRVRSDLMEERTEAGIPEAARTDAAEAALHFFLVNGRLDQGRAFARRLDRDLETGPAFQRTWVDYLRWNGLPERALALLEALQQQEPGDRELMRLAGEIASQTGNVPRLARSLERRLRLDPGSERLRASLAELYWLSGDPDRAFPLYEALHRDHPRDPAYLGALLSTAEASEDPALKVRAADLAGGVEPRDAALLERRAELYLAAERPRKAWPLLSVLAGRTGGDEEAVRRMLQAARYTDDPEVLKEALAQALALRPSDRDLQKEASDAFLWLDGPERAYRAQRELVRGSGAVREDVFRLIELALFTDRPGNEREAVMLAARRLQGPDVRVLRGRVPEIPGEIADGEVLAAVRDYLDRHPGDTAFRDRLIGLYLDSGRPGRAAPLLADRSDRSPGDPQKALEAGEAFLQADRLRQGLRFFERTLSLEPENTDLLRRLVTYYGWLGMRKEQVAGLARLEGKGLLKPGERLRLAEALLERGEGNRALEVLRPLEDRDPLPEEEGVLLAAAYDAAGRRERALAVYRRLARDHRDDPELLAGLGDRALWLDRLPAALEFYEAALRLDPKNLRALKGSGQIYAWNNSPERAIERFEAYNRLEPDDFEVRYQLGELYFANERKGAAFREYRKTLGLIDRKKRGVTPP